MKAALQTQITPILKYDWLNNQKCLHRTFHLSNHIHKPWPPTHMASQCSFASLNLWAVVLWFFTSFSLSDWCIWLSLIWRSKESEWGRSNQLLYMMHLSIYAFQQWYIKNKSVITIYCHVDLIIWLRPIYSGFEGVWGGIWKEWVLPQHQRVLKKKPYRRPQTSTWRKNQSQAQKLPERHWG